MDAGLTKAMWSVYCFVFATRTKRRKIMMYDDANVTHADKYMSFLPFPSYFWMCLMCNWSQSLLFWCHIFVDCLSVVSYVICDGKEHQIHDILITLNCICRRHFTRLMEMLWLTLQICVWFNSPVRWREIQPPWGTEVTQISRLLPGASQSSKVICANTSSGANQVMVQWLQLTIHCIYYKYTPTRHNTT